MDDSESGNQINGCQVLSGKDCLHRRGTGNSSILLPIPEP